MSELKAPHPLTPSTSSSTDEKPSPGSGKYGAYYDPVLPASKEMKDIVGNMMSMAGGVKAVLFQIAEPSVGAGVYEHSSFTRRPIERGESVLSNRAFIFVFRF